MPATGARPSITIKIGIRNFRQEFMVSKLPQLVVSIVARIELFLRMAILLSFMAKVKQFGDIRMGFLNNVNYH